MDEKEVEMYLYIYDNVSREQFENIRDSVIPFNKTIFESKLKSLHQYQGDGTHATRVGPLIHLYSISVQPIQKDSGDKIAMHGRISVQFRDPTYKDMVGHDLYIREPSEFEEITDTLTLNGPDHSCWPYNAYIPLFGNKISIDLFDGANMFMQKTLSLEDKDIGEDDYEQVKNMSVSGEKGTIILHYTVIPLGVVCRVEFMFYSRSDVNKDENKCRFVNVNGKIVARYGNINGSYASEETSLFDKQPNKFEQVQIDSVKSMRLSRFWVALPAYSSLAIGVHLSEFGTGREIVNTTVEFSAQNESFSSNSFVFDDIVIQVQVSRFSPTPWGPHSADKIIQREDEGSPSLPGVPTGEMDIDRNDESSDDDDVTNDESPSWALRPHVSKPLPSPALEIFTVFIGSDKSEAQIYGSMEIYFDYHTVYIFKRDENDALLLSKYMKSAPILDGFRDYEEDDGLVMKFDIKDVEKCLDIKGYVEWAASTLESDIWYDKQLCSFIQGKNGFVAVHYSIFSNAVQANIKVSVKPKMGAVDVYVYGSLIAQYSCYDYSSRYNRDHYRFVLFRSIQDDSILLNVDWTLPLSRSMIVVPSYSSIILNADLLVGVTNQKVSFVEEIGIGDCRKSIETHEYFLDIEVEWREVDTPYTSDGMIIDKSKIGQYFA